MKFVLYARKSTDREERQALSIESQLAELRALARREHLKIARVLIESRTAKAPGRPLFNEMIRDIEQGDVQGILAWHPDRLARNAVDGGRIIHLLDTGKLLLLKFSTFWFENTPQGKFMLQIAFGQSKYYVDNLSENIKRGLRQKIRRGEFPQKAPVGYANEPRLRTLVVDEQKAPYVRVIFRRFATGRYTLSEICTAANMLGLTSMVGHPLTERTMRDMLLRPQYNCKFMWSGEMRGASHPRLFSGRVFSRVQSVLKRQGIWRAPRSEHHHR